MSGKRAKIKNGAEFVLKRTFSCGGLSLDPIPSLLSEFLNELPNIASTVVPNWIVWRMHGLECAPVKEMMALHFPHSRPEKELGAF